MEKRPDYSTYDPGLKRDLIKIFSKAIGKHNAIPRPELLKLLGKWYTKGDYERKVRAAIVDLRNEGHLICSTGGTSGGYWLAENWAEVTEFTSREYHSRAMSMLETEKNMKRAAQEKWGPEQPRLF